jgi:PhnB protein
MVQNPPEDFPRITPYLLYEDVDAAVDWLTNAFGFTERLRFKGEDGRSNHAEIVIADGVVMLGSPDTDYKNPKRLGGVTQFVHVYVDEIDRHCEAAKAAGARIVRPPEDQFYGDRRYHAEDPEGHMWSFAQHIRDVEPDEMQQG